MISVIPGLLVVCLSVLAAIGGLGLVQRLVPATTRKEHNDVAGFIYAVLGVAYAVLVRRVSGESIAGAPRAHPLRVDQWITMGIIAVWILAVVRFEAPLGLAAFAAGILAFAGIGALLGSVMPSSRAAQGLGLLLFLGTFLLVGGGPPPGVLPDLVKDIAAWTPTGLLIDAIRAPWAGGGLDWPAMVTLALVAVAGFTFAARRLARS